MGISHFTGLSLTTAAEAVATSACVLAALLVSQVQAVASNGFRAAELRQVDIQPLAQEAVPDPDGGLVAAATLLAVLTVIAIVIRARTAERRAAGRVAESDKSRAAATNRLDAISSLHGLSVLQFDAPGVLRSADADFERATGLSAAALAGRGWLAAVVPDDGVPIDASWQNAAALRLPLDVRLRTHSSAWGVRRHRLRAEPMSDGTSGWLGAILDVEDLCLAEDTRDKAVAAERQARIETEAALQLKDDLLRTVSHELRTPLNAIVGWAEVLRASGIDAMAGQGAEAIARNARALALLIDDMLDAATVLHGGLQLRLESMDLRRVVDDAVAAMAPAVEAKALDVDVAIGDQPVEMTGDQARLRQVVRGLISNAVKSLPRGGRLTVRLAQHGSRILLTVADSGEGITPALLPHVFDPFRQGRVNGQTKGLGLGLAIAHQVVELHGGAIAAESPGPGLGATFTVTLPTVPSGRLHDAAPQAVRSRIRRP